MARTNLSVDERVFENFSLQARQQNKTLFAFANECLSAVSEICAEGGNASEMHRLWRVVSILKQVDIMTLPTSFLDDLIEKEYSTDKDGVLKMFWDLGSGLVVMLKLVAGTVEDLAEKAKDFALLLPLKSFKVSNDKNGLLEVSIIGAGKKMTTAECSAEFMKSVLNGYGYAYVKQELGIGTIRIWVQKRGLT